MKNDISAGQDKMKNDVQEQIKNDSGIHDKVSTDMSDIRADQAEFEEWMIDALNMQLKGITAMVQQEIKRICEVNSELRHVTRHRNISSRPGSHAAGVQVPVRCSGGPDHTRRRKRRDQRGQGETTKVRRIRVLGGVPPPV
jgi:hypothetical protein